MGDVSILKRLLREVRAFRLQFAVALLLYIPVTLFALAQPLLIGAAVDRGFRTQDLDQVMLWASLFTIVVVVYALTEMGQLYMMQSVGLRLVKIMRQRLFAKIQELSMSFFDHTPLGRVLTRVTNDVESVSELFSSGAVAIFGDLFFLIGTLVMLFAVNVELAFASTAVLPLLAFGLWLMRKWMRQAYYWVRASLSRVNTYLQEHLSGMTTVQLFAQVDRARDQFDKNNSEFMQANRRAILLDAAIYSFVDAVSTAAVAAVLWAGFDLHQKGALQLGVMVAFIEALSRFFQPIRELANKYTVFQSALVSGERIFEMLDLPIEVASTQNKLALFEKGLAFENVSFSYATGAAVLTDVSIRIQKGERIALVGHTGAGKSTITKLVTRFYDVTKGSITFDGVDIRELELASLRQLFNVVPQEVFLFAGTLRDNLRYGREQASDVEILHALELCQATYLLQREGGLEAQVGARGQNFSLGERQLLALARALIANPQIIIMDEATASVDTQTERHLQKATNEVLKNRTALIVAHRLTTIRDCDRILVFHRGRLAEEGTHQELIEKQGIYAKLVELQTRESQLGIMEEANV